MNGVVVFAACISAVLCGGYDYKDYIYRGKYGGKCGNDGLYFRDESSFVFCSNGNSYVQPCAPGSKNSNGYDYFKKDKTYGYRDFCDVNLVDHGYGKDKGYGKGNDKSYQAEKGYQTKTTGYAKNDGYATKEYKNEGYGKQEYGYGQGYETKDYGYGRDVGYGRDAGYGRDYSYGKDYNRGYGYGYNNGYNGNRGYGGRYAY